LLFSCATLLALVALLLALLRLPAAPTPTRGSATAPLDLLVLAAEQQQEAVLV
jgi:hypothetical protein